MAKVTTVKIDCASGPVFISHEPWHEIELFLSPHASRGGIYILTDQNTYKYCLPRLKDNLTFLQNCPVFALIPGDESKNLLSLEMIWHWLMENNAGRDSLLVNLGGGVVSDLGGFAAATFKRGMPYINVPTTLIGQADAAIGGKTGINVAGFKNQAGLFSDPSAVFINPAFLETLPDEHFKSGFAEIIKCAALAGNDFWKEVKNYSSGINHQLEALIIRSVDFKCRITSQDPLDRSIRKILNFGHTIGHAIESCFNRPGRKEIFHGEAIAIGMICESILSHELEGLSQDETGRICGLIRARFDLRPLETGDHQELIRFMQQDKKMNNRGIGFTLLKNVGNPVFDRVADMSHVLRSFNSYNHFMKSDHH